MSRFITVDVHTSPWDAHITKGRLESEGIPVFVAHDQHISTNWMYSQALGGVKLQVPAEHAPQAFEVLGAIRAGECLEALRQECPDLEVNACPQCGSAEFISLFSTKTIALIFFLYFGCGVVFPARKDRHTCFKCDRKWVY